MSSNETITPAPAASLQLDRVIAELPAALDEAMRETWAGYTPELARQFADHMAARLRAGTHATSVPAEESRTITYPLKTGGTLTHTCPDFCTYDHTDDVTQGINRTDLMHQGDKAGLDYGIEGIEQSILQARIVSWPFDRDGDTAPYVELIPEGRTGVGRICDSPLVLDEEIRKVRGHLRALKEMADRLAEAQADDHARIHQSDEAPWASLTRTDLMSMPIAYLVRTFGVTVVETEDVGREAVAALYGEPGEMLLQVHPALPQQLREDETRKALLAWHGAQSGVGRG
ncbi:DUF6907 domain-containing protein [Streptomyces sp. NPDC101152]|uniref:DUF6907 domain-containing protein n=1 Tax=Streptomyces sp. NPDC101152 TaxID=3366116 RepID=UPI0038066BCB